MIKYADIALNIPFKTEETLTYQIPEEMTNLKVGCRVEFELRNKKMEGLVIEIHFNMPSFELKRIKRQIDKDPIINAEQIQLAYWMRDFYVSSLGESLYKMIPSGRKNQLSEPAPLGSPELLKLNEEQNISYEKIKSSIGKESIHLLYGITGSGKTEVYIHLFHHILTQTDKSAILLVPEISLTFQILHRLELIFGKQLALIHSNLRVSERFKNYLQLLRGEKRIVIGTRSAIFAPVKNLGLIIMDEEHDMSYKEHSSPRYHARQVAQQRIKMNHATLVLGSATPSLESFYHAKKGIINLHVLTKRAKNSSLSTVSVLPKKEDKELVGEDLLFKIKQRLDKK
ncbi:MAG: DEAD/DEAH box helicase, partial [Spirochaetia bacterium]|nr:DEAD/DEAH box helicase [Spirochaetia bacterium]